MGCRQRAYRSVLLRVVVAEVGGLQSAVPDPDRRSAGRGASMHFSSACLDAAERRRAFPRALRHPG
ncbi:MAG TPA: YlxR family protein, partial [Kineosporiaceae bacterium]|nr:YlxR family protein [Kineosporiaceae bacterium]